MNPRGRLASVGWLLATGGFAQAPTDPDGPTAAPRVDVRVELAADSEHLGPPAWTTARTDWLPTLAGWRDGTDPAASIALRFDGRRWHQLGADRRSTLPAPTPDPTPVSTASSGSTYARAIIELAEWRVLAVCDRDGRERWQITRRSTDHATASTRGLTTALSALGIVADGQPIVIDTTAWLGRLVDSIEGDDHKTRWLLLASECGPTTLTVRANRGGHGWTAVGRSDGGLLLPALLTLQAHHGSGNRLPAALQWDHRHALRATTRLDIGAEEATRQLVGRVLRSGGGGSWREALECQLFASDGRQSIAAAGLLRTENPGAWRTVAGFDIGPEQNPAGHALAELAKLRLRHRTAEPQSALSQDDGPRPPRSHPSAGSGVPPGQPRESLERSRNGLVGGTILALILAAALWIRSRMD